MARLSDSMDAIAVWLADPTTGLPYRGGSPVALTAGADRSGTTSATANTSASLAPANPSRIGLLIQNISANPIGINEIGGAAAIGSPGTYTLAAGASTRVNTNRAVTVVSGTASQPYTATEF